MINSSVVGTLWLVSVVYQVRDDEPGQEQGGTRHGASISRFGGHNNRDDGVEDGS